MDMEDARGRALSGGNGRGLGSMEGGGMSETELGMAAVVIA